MVSLLYLEVEVHNVVCVHVLNIVTLLAKLYHRILTITLLEGLKLMMIWIVSKSDSFDFTHTRRKRLSLIHRNYCLFFKLFEIFDLLFHLLFIDLPLIMLLMLWHPCIKILVEALDPLGHPTQLSVKISLLLRLDFKFLHIKLVLVNILLFQKLLQIFLLYPLLQFFFFFIVNIAAVGCDYIFILFRRSILLQSVFVASHVSESG